MFSQQENTFKNREVQRISTTHEKIAACTIRSTYNHLLTIQCIDGMNECKEEVEDDEDNSDSVGMDRDRGKQQQSFRVFFSKQQYDWCLTMTERIHDKDFLC